ncbi:ABC transporter ATP-binding protein, partial [Mycoplasmopsis synoviae]
MTFDKRVKIFETLDKLGILNKAFSRVSDLSGGQKQKVEIAKLLIKDVDLILGDEPTSNLDYKSANSVMEILKEINKKLNITIIINIHDLNLATSYFDQIIMIKDKQIFLNESINLKNKW